jgi:hypothetical protein
LVAVLVGVAVSGPVAIDQILSVPLCGAAIQRSTPRNMRCIIGLTHDQTRGIGETKK